MITVPGAVQCKRPKSHRLLLGQNRLGQLRVIRNKKYPPTDADFQMHIYGATLPRCPRLKKRVRFNWKMLLLLVLGCFRNQG